MGFTFITTPTDTSVTNGEPVTFTVATSGVPLIGVVPVEYQWKYYSWWDNTNHTITGETNTSYTFTSSLADNEKLYFCEVNSIYRSKSAKLTIKTYMPTFTQPLSANLALEEISPFLENGNVRPFRTAHTLPVSGTHNVQWSKGGVDGVVTENYRFFPNYKIDHGSMVKCRLNFVYPEGTLTRSTQTNVYVNPMDPIIIEHPKNQTLFAGNDIFLRAKGIETNENISYQWWMNDGSDSIIVGATGQTYDIVATSGDNENTYWCKVIGTSATVDTDVAEITILDDKYNYSLQRINDSSIGIDSSDLILNLSLGNLKYSAQGIWKSHKFNLTGAEEAVQKLSQYISDNGITSIKTFLDEVKPAYTELNDDGGITMTFDIGEGDGGSTSVVTSAGIGEEYVAYDVEETLPTSGMVYLKINGEFQYDDTRYMPAENANWSIEQNPPNSQSTLVYASSAGEDFIPNYINIIESL